MTIPICLWPNVKATVPEQLELSWEQLCDRLTTFLADAPRDQAPLWSPTRYRPDATRGNDGVEIVSCLVLDVDCGIVLEDVAPSWDERGLAYVVHSTAHHLQPKRDQPAVPRWRVVFPLRVPILGSLWRDVYPRLATHLIGTAWDPACCDPARMSWLPMITEQHFASVHDGAWLNPADAPAIAPSPAPLPARRFGDAASPSPRRGLSPGDDYSERGEHAGLLTAHGWKYQGQSGSNELWTRPDKRNGTSATWNDERRVFFCFTSSTSLQPCRGYSLFQLYSALDHRGDYSAAARALARRGFGAKQTLSTPTDSTPHVEVPDGAAVARTVIHVTTDMADVVNQLEAALAAMRPRRIYQRGGRLVRVTIDADPPRGLSKVRGAVGIGLAPLGNLTEMASRAADWLKYDKRSEAWVPTIPPTWAVQQLADRGRWSLPPLSGIIEAPALRPDGTVIESAGYDEDTGLVLTAQDVYPAVPQNPSRDEALRSVAELSEVFADFPSVADFDRSAILAALLTVVCRDVIDGPVPLFAVNACAAGTGKSLLVDVISAIACGRKASRMAQARDESEECKRLLAIAIEGIRLVLIDNLTRPLGSGALDATLTSGFVTDRILGSTETRTVAWRAVVFATGNNVQVRGDTGRRVIPINLDAEVEQPEERTGWTHDPLLDWVLENRPRLVVACLTVLRAFVVAGRLQVQRSRIGSYEGWDDVVRGALMWLGVADPATGRQQMRAESDSDLDDLRTLLHVWWTTYGDTPVTGLRLVRDAQSASGIELKQALGAFDSKWRGGDGPVSAKPIGWALKRHRGRLVDGLRLELVRRDKHGNSWRVEDHARSIDVSEDGVLEVLEVLFQPSIGSVSDRSIVVAGSKPQNLRNPNQTTLTGGRWWEPRAGGVVGVRAGGGTPDDNDDDNDEEN